MTDRERLIELLEKYKSYDSAITKVVQRPMVENLADYLLENDVTKVIRCEDCKYYYCVDNKTRLCTNKNNLTLKTALTISREHYCSYGELKEREG